MNQSPVDIIRREQSMIQQIIDDEKWLESERRGFDVGLYDSQLIHNTSEIILKVGADIRRQAIDSLRNPLVRY